MIYMQPKSGHSVRKSWKEGVALDLHGMVSLTLDFESDSVHHTFQAKKLSPDKRRHQQPIASVTLLQAANFSAIPQDLVVFLLSLFSSSYPCSSFASPLVFKFRCGTNLPQFLLPLR